MLSIALVIILIVVAVASIKYACDFGTSVFRRRPAASIPIADNPVTKLPPCIDNAIRHHPMAQPDHLTELARFMLRCCGVLKLEDSDRARAFNRIMAHYQDEVFSLHGKIHRLYQDDLVVKQLHNCDADTLVRWLGTHPDFVSLCAENYDLLVRLRGYHYNCDANDTLTLDRPSSATIGVFASVPDGYLVRSALPAYEQHYINLPQMQQLALFVLTVLGTRQLPGYITLETSASLYSLHDKFEQEFNWPIANFPASLGTETSMEIVNWFAKEDRFFAFCRTVHPDVTNWLAQFHGNGAINNKDYESLTQTLQIIASVTDTAAYYASAA